MSGLTIDVRARELARAHYLPEVSVEKHARVFLLMGDVVDAWTFARHANRALGLGLLDWRVYKQLNDFLRDAFGAMHVVRKGRADSGKRRVPTVEDGVRPAPRRERAA